MLSLGLTGGIAAGKSLLSTRFRQLGAVVIDADQLARDAVAPGTTGLSAVVEHFGAHLLLPDGSLDRPQLGSLVFADPAAREALNAIVHPRVRAAAKALKDSAAPGAIVVQDIPLLVETGQGANFHLVVVVEAPLDVRVARMMGTRGMSREDALARMDAQASDEERAAAADVVIVNDGDAGQALAAVDALWHGRLLPFAANLAAGRPADWPAAPPHRSGGSQLAGPGRHGWRPRVRRLWGRPAVAVDHIGATAVAGRPAPDVLELRVQLRPDADTEAVIAPLAAAGFPMTGRAGGGGSVHWSADPGRPATLAVVVGALVQDRRDKRGGLDLAG